MERLSMSWKQMVHDLKLSNEKQFFDLLKRAPADPIVYLIKVQDKIGVDVQDYYKVLLKKAEEEKNRPLYHKIEEIVSLLKER